MQNGLPEVVPCIAPARLLSSRLLRGLAGSVGYLGHLRVYARQQAYDVCRREARVLDSRRYL